MELGNRHKRRGSCRRDTWDEWRVISGVIEAVHQSHVLIKLSNLSFVHGHQVSFAVFGGVVHANVSHRI
jgi:hypothetical protein